MRNVYKLISLLIILSILIAGTVACKSNPTSTLDETTVRAYADPATEITLQGLSENNLAKYTQYGNAEFKAALTQETLDKTYAQINSQLGAYQSKELLRIEEQQGYILVHYKAKFEKEDVGVRMVFDKDHLVAGQWFE
jgi:hypothetical protein